MKTDFEIQKDIRDQLKWEPFLKNSEIAVTVKNGMVIISGKTDSYLKKVLIENTIKKVAGVNAITGNIEVDIPAFFCKTDTEIFNEVINALKWHTMIPEEKIRVSVKDGAVTMEGEVEWDYQRVQVETAVENLIGVRAVTNLVAVAPKVFVGNVQQKVNSAFRRNATIDAGKIKAEVLGSRIILYGTVRSFAEKDAAENAAWLAPGVVDVENQIEIAQPIRPTMVENLGYELL